MSERPLLFSTVARCESELNNLKDTRLGDNQQGVGEDIRVCYNMRVYSMQNVKGNEHQMRRRETFILDDERNRCVYIGRATLCELQ